MSTTTSQTQIDNKSPYRRARDRGEAASFPAINLRDFKNMEKRPADSYRGARRDRFFGRD